MRPKAYYEQLVIQEDKRYIFALMPPEFEEQYKTYIKGTIERIEIDNGSITCESNLDIKMGTDNLDETWKNIQRAGIIIANITGFDSGVMLELGVAMMKKTRVILIAEKSVGEGPNLPFNISTLDVEFYESDNLDIFSRKLVNLVKRIIPTDHILLAPRVSVLMKKVSKLRRNRDFETAFVLLKEMNEIEPKNWYVYKEWAITHEYNKNYEEAVSMLKKALELAAADRQKAEIYTALGAVFQKSKQEEKALDSFRKAENHYSDDADLYDKWAFLLYTMGKYQEAMNKMIRALKKDDANKEFYWKLEFYTKKLTDKNFGMSLIQWLSLKQEENKSPSKIPPDRIASQRTLYRPGPSVPGKNLRFKIDKRLTGKKHIRESKKEDEIWENIVAMYAQVKDIDDEHGLVYLNCKYKKDSDETFERMFPLKHFKNKNKLKVDQSILVNVYEKPGEVRFLFDEVDEDFFDKDVEDISINDPDYSAIFKPL